MHVLGVTKSYWSGWKQACANIRDCSSVETTRLAWRSETVCSTALMFPKKWQHICNLKSTVYWCAVLL